MIIKEGRLINDNNIIVPIKSISTIEVKTKKPKYGALIFLLVMGVLHVLPFIVYGSPKTGLDTLVLLAGVIMCLIAILNLVMAKNTYVLVLNVKGVKMDFFKSKNGIEVFKAYDDINDLM